MNDVYPGLIFGRHTSRKKDIRIGKDVLKDAMQFEIWQCVGQHEDGRYWIRGPKFYEGGVSKLISRSDIGKIVPIGLSFQKIADCIETLPELNEVKAFLDEK